MTGGARAPAPLFSEVAKAPENGTAAWLAADDGVMLRAAHWGRGSAERGTVLVFSGRTEYVEKYGPLASDLLARGYATVSVDWRGQGLAGRVHPEQDLGHVGRFRDYQKDVAALLAFARRERLPEPFYLIAHSMGGCIGLRSLHEGLPVKAALFSAPMWGIKMGRALRPFAWALSHLSRPLGFSGRVAPGQQPYPYVLRVPFEGNTLTSDREMWNFMGEQARAHPELALGGPTLNWLYEALFEMRALARMKSPDYPVHTFLGSEELIVDPAPIHARMPRWEGGRFDVVDGARHEVLMERPETRRRVLDAADALFSAHR